MDCLKFLNPGIIVQLAGYLDNYNLIETPKGYFRYYTKVFLTLKKYMYIKKLNHASNIQIIGLTSNLNDLIMNCDLLISPFSKEHFSRPIIEAFAYKKPVIGSDVKGMDEIIDHEINGFIVEKNNANALANVINMLFHNREKGREMGIRGFEKASELYSQNNVELIENIYNSI